MVGLMLLGGCTNGSRAAESGPDSSTPGDAAATSTGEPVAAVDGVLRERVGQGRPTAAAAADGTTVIATTIGAVMIRDGDTTALPTSALQPTDGLTLSPDGSAVILHRLDSAELWSLDPDGPPRLLATTATAPSATITADGRAVMATWTEILVLDTSDGAILDRVPAPAGRTFGAAAADPAGGWWAASTTGGDQPEILLAVGTAEPEAWVIDDHPGFNVTRLATDPSGTRLAIGLGDATLTQSDEVAIGDPISRRLLWSTPADTTEVWDIGRDGSVLITGQAGARFIGADGIPTPVPESYVGDLPPLAVRHLAGGGYLTLLDSGRRVLHGPDGEVIESHDGVGRLLHASGGDGPITEVALVTLDGRVEILDGDGAFRRWVDDLVGGLVNDVAMADDGTLAIATSTGAVSIVAPGEARPADPLVLVNPEGSVDSVAFAPDGDRLLAGIAARTGSLAFDDTVAMWDLERGTRRAEIGGTNEEVAGCSAFFNPVHWASDGSFAVATSHDFTVFLIDGRTDEVLQEISAHAGPVVDTALSPDDTRLATVSEDLTLRLWDTSSGELVAEYPTTLGGLRSLAFLPDGHTVLTSDLLGQLSLIDLDDGATVRTFDAGRSRNAEPELSPDGRLVAAGDGPVVRLWSVDTGAVVGELGGHSGEVVTATFSPDGTSLVAGSTDGTVTVWDLTGT